MFAHGHSRLFTVKIEQMKQFNRRCIGILCTFVKLQLATFVAFLHNISKQYEALPSFSALAELLVSVQAFGLHGISFIMLQSCYTVMIH